MNENKSEATGESGLDCSMLQTFFDASPQGVVVLHEGVFVYINEALAKTMGVTPDLIVGNSIELLTRVLSPEDREYAMKRLGKVIGGDRISYKSRYPVTNRLGEKYVLEITANSIEIDDKTYVIAYADDVTTDEETRENVARERKAYGIIAEAALSTETTAQVCDKVLSGLIDNLGFDLGTIRLFNLDDQTLELISVVGLDEESVVPSVAINDPSVLSARTARTKQPLFIPDISEISKDLRRMHKPKKLELRSLIFWPIISADDSLLGVINVASRTTQPIIQADRVFFATLAGMASTILERRKTEEQLQDSQEQFISFADNMPGPVFIKDHKSRVLFVNRFMRTSQQPNSDDIATEDLFNKKRAEELAIEDQKVLARGPIERIHKTRDKEGKIRTYRSYKFPIFREGKPPLIGGFSLDITDRVEAENQREEAKARAEFFNDLMAHDINNMHQGIMASLELIIEEEGLPERLKNIADRALQQVNRSVSLINNVKKFAMVNEGDIKLEKIDPAESLIVAIETVKHSFPNRLINVKTNIRKGKYCIMANEFLQDVFYNLLHNAVKVTNTQEVEIEVEVSLFKDGEYLKIDFVDWGTGINDGMKETILTSLDERVHRVSGVGLTLVKQIIDQYSGEISVEDRIKGNHTKGARFVILLPYGC